MISKHFPAMTPDEVAAAVRRELVYMFSLNTHIEHDALGEEVVALKGYRPEVSRRRRR